MFSDDADKNVKNFLIQIKIDIQIIYNHQKVMNLSTIMSVIAL